MDQREHYTVQEVAAIVGVSSQAIYQRMTKNLKPFVITLNGRKVLHRDALKVLTVNEPTNENQQSKDEASNLKALERVVEVLTAQLAIKDKQINQLNEILSQAMKNQGMGHAVEAARQIEAPGVKRSWFDRVFKREQ